MKNRVTSFVNAEFTSKVVYARLFIERESSNLISLSILYVIGMISCLLGIVLSWHTTKVVSSVTISRTRSGTREMILHHPLMTPTRFYSFVA